MHEQGSPGRSVTGRAGAPLANHEGPVAGALEHLRQEAEVQRHLQAVFRLLLVQAGEMLAGPPRTALLVPVPMPSSPLSGPSPPSS